MRFFIIICLLLGTSSAQAQEKVSGDPPAMISPSQDLEGWHLAGAYFSGLASTVVFAIAGLGIGDVVGSWDCDEGPTPNCHSPAEHMIAGAALGTAVGTAPGVYAYGELTGHEGSFWYALAGSGVTLIVVGGATSIFMGFDRGFPITMLFTPVGAIIGYNFYTPTRDEQPRSAALIDVSPTTGVRFGVPDLRWTRKGQEDQWFISLVGGRF